jgi:hypothetical protein
MTRKLKIIMTLSIVKWAVLKFIVPIYFILQIIADIGEPSFYVTLGKSIGYIILSLIVLKLAKFEMFLSRNEIEWLDKETGRIKKEENNK